MRRSDFAMKLVSFMLLVAIALYIGISLYNSAANPMKTTEAVSCTVEKSGPADGYSVRNESLIDGGGTSISITAGEGEKVASGEEVAVRYDSDSALERANEIHTLKLKIEQAQAAVSASGAAVGVAQAEGSVLALSSAVQHGDLGNLDELSSKISGFILKNVKSDSSSSDISAMQSQLSSLESENTGAKSICASESGIFSSIVDGYESVGPDMLRGLTPDSLASLFAADKATGKSSALGKLVTGTTWYYAAVMNSSDASRLTENDVKTVEFTNTFRARIPMKVESIGADESGKCVVVFSCDRNMSDTVSIRKMTANVVFESYTGIRIPKEAIYLDDSNKPYIYLLKGLQAEQVYVDIQCEDGDSYVVKDGSENNTVLREGSDIIVKAKNLYKDKVVQR